MVVPDAELTAVNIAESRPPIILFNACKSRKYSGERAAKNASRQA
jgi:hypothetical protein